MSRLEGKVVFITAAAQGMGESHTRRAVEEGAKVIITDVNETDGKVLADELGSNTIFVKHDVAKADSWKHAVEIGTEAFGEITVLINNAGILGPIAKTADLSEEDYMKVCNVNQMGIYLGMKYIIPSMLKAGVGSIINLSSTAGIVAHYGTSNLAYVGSKFAVRGMTKQAAIEYGLDNIRINSVHPGFIRTPMLVEDNEVSDELINNLVPLGRIAEPEDVSNLIVFLASDESSYITGTEQLIEGGLTAR